MGYREVTVIEVGEVLRLWLGGDMGLGRIADSVGADRKFVRRYIQAAVAAGLVRNADEGQLTDELLGAVVEAVRPDRARGHGQAWQACAAERGRIKDWLDKGLTLTKVCDLLGRRGVVVPYPTLHRFAAEELGYRRRQLAVRVADCGPGAELQVDFGRLGMISHGGRRRVLWALIFTAVFSRHMFVWLTLRQALADVIGGFEAARGVLRRRVRRGDPRQPQSHRRSSRPGQLRGVNPTFGEYAQARGLVIDLLGCVIGQDKPRVERAVRYTRESFLADQDFAGLADAQRRG